MKKTSLKPQLTVVYDGQCKLCLATVDKLKNLPIRAQLTFVSLQSLISGQVKIWPGIEDVTLDELSAQMHVTDEQGRRFSGSEGLLFLMRQIPSLSWLGRLGALPGFNGLIRLIYRIVARYRYRLFGKIACSDGVCEIPQRAQEDGGEMNDPRR
ncbi:thiol-disulfide oxidoreductase DCC family protein [Cohnella abietis]|uniref:Thiol-disulfide oxidoreductase n=1 Tax=Cohnella abietis TaxID=2507935 RepID=A0A3T1D3J3_9BACL|nr:DUF393 domain-containing protein [Cohnella abietis]BBI32555.1 thiol-disulfide oxidoreductase [Cohnella abietis]